MLTIAGAEVVTVGPKTDVTRSGYGVSIAGVTYQQMLDQKISKVISWKVPMNIPSAVAALTFILFVIKSNASSVLYTSTCCKALLKIIWTSL